MFEDIAFPERWELLKKTDDGYVYRIEHCTARFKKSVPSGIDVTISADDGTLLENIPKVYYTDKVIQYLKFIKKKKTNRLTIAEALINNKHKKYHYAYGYNLVKRYMHRDCVLAYINYYFGAYIIIKTERSIKAIEYSDLKYRQKFELITVNHAMTTIKECAGKYFDCKLPDHDAEVEIVTSMI